MRSHHRLSGLLAGAVLTASGLAAQALRPAGDAPRNAVTVELLRPALKSSAIGADLGFLTFMSRLDLRYAVSGAVITAGLPYTVVTVPDAGFPAGNDFSSTQVGNLGVGIVLAPDQPVIAGFEVLIPTASGGGDDDGDLAVAAGLGADYSDLEMYLPDVLSLRGTFGYRLRQAGGVTMRFATRPSLLIPTGDLSGDPELFVDYAVQLDYETGGWTVGTAFNGRVLATEDNFFFGRVVHTMDLGAVWRASRTLHPGMVLRIPLDGELDDLVGVSVGLRFEMPLGAR